MPDVVALAGGVGGSKLAFGLYAALKDRLAVIVNTGDDDEMYGLRVCPDLDTMRYTLSGMGGVGQGWGIAGDTFHALEQLRRYGLDAWFQIGDRDLATDMARTHLLRQGLRLTEVEAYLDERSGLTARLLPMCDEPVATRVRTPSEELAFQEYFVHRGHTDPVVGVSFSGIDRAAPSPEILMALASCGLVVFCPSNPAVSIGPILSVPGLRDALKRAGSQRVAVSPIVGGAAVSGPAGQMMQALGFDVSVIGLAEMYRDLLTGIVIDETDRASERELRSRGLRVLVTRTIMADQEDRRRLAREVLDWANAA